MNRTDENHSFNVNVCKALGHIEKAILLKEIYGWCYMNKAKGKNIKIGVSWTYMPAKGYAEKFPYMNPKSISRWLRQLEDDGFIFSHNFNRVAYDRTKWYTINASSYDYAVQHSEISISQNEEWKYQIEESIRHFEESKDQNEEPIPSTTTSTYSPTTKEKEEIKNFSPPSLDSKESFTKFEKEKPKEKNAAKKEKVVEYPADFSESMIVACKAWFEYRKQIGFPFSNVYSKQTRVMAWQAEVSEYGENIVIASIYEAISQNWRKTYPKPSTPKKYAKKEKQAKNREVDGVLMSKLEGLKNRGIITYKRMEEILSWDSDDDISKEVDKLMNQKPQL